MSLLRTHQDVVEGETDVKRLAPLIRSSCAKFLLDPKLVACIILHESGGDEWAYRYEEGFYDRFLKNKRRHELLGYVPNFPPTLESEKRARAISWGPMQIMGETARVMGYTGRWLPRCGQAATNIDLGCKYLHHLCQKYKAIEDPQVRLFQVIKSWNGTGPEAYAYAETILSHYHEERRWRSILE